MAWPFRKKTPEEVKAELEEHELREAKWRRWQWRKEVAKIPIKVVSYPFRRREAPSPQPVQVTVQQPPAYIKEKRKGGRLILFLIIVVAVFLYIFAGCPLAPGIISGNCDVAKAWGSEKIGKPVTIVKDFFTRTIPEIVKYPEETLQHISVWNPNVVPEKPTERRGIIISEFKPDIKYFSENEEVILSGIIDLKNIQNDLELTISCESKDYLEPIKVRLIAENQESETEISTLVKGSLEGITQQLQVQCILPKGFTIDDKDKLRTAKKVTLNAKYDVRATTFLDLYVANPEQRQRYGFGAHLFIKNDLLDNLKSSGLWKEDGVIRSVQRGPRVPIPPSIELFGKQPVTTESRLIRVKLLNTERDRLEWSGELDKLKYLQIQSLNKDLIIDNNNCPGFSDGILSDNIIKQINERYCSIKEESDEACTRFKRDISFDCGIRILNTPEGDLLDVNDVEVNTVYTYKVDKDVSVEIRKKQQENLFATTTDNIMTGAISFVENLLKQPMINY